MKMIAAIWCWDTCFETSTIDEQKLYLGWVLLRENTVFNYYMSCDIRILLGRVGAQKTMELGFFDDIVALVL